MTIIRPLTVLALAIAGLTACDNPGLPTSAEGTGPLLAKGGPKGGSQTFLANAAGAPSLATLRLSFWAVKGETREAELYYHASPGSPDSTRLVRIRVERRSLLSLPNGMPIADGDSVEITLTVADSSNLIVRFEPSGLRFDPNRPARLWFKWSETEPDLNGDGVVNRLDLAIQRTFAIWRQENPGSIWEPLESNVNTNTEQVEAKIDGFTRYAVSY